MPRHRPNRRRPNRRKPGNRVQKPRDGNPSKLRPLEAQASISQDKDSKKGLDKLAVAEMPGRHASMSHQANTTTESDPNGETSSLTYPKEGHYTKLTDEEKEIALLGDGIIKLNDQEPPYPAPDAQQQSLANNTDGRESAQVGQPRACDTLVARTELGNQWNQRREAMQPAPKHVDDAVSDNEAVPDEELKASSICLHQ